MAPIATKTIKGKQQQAICLTRLLTWGFGKTTSNSKCEPLAWIFFDSMVKTMRQLARMAAPLRAAVWAGISCITDICGIL